jgi:signal recognition particle subunit SEC65
MKNLKTKDGTEENDISDFNDSAESSNDASITSKKSIKKNLPETLNNVIDEVTLEYIEELDKNNPPHPYEIEKELLSRVNSVITIENMKIPSILTGTDKNGNKKHIKERDRWQ